MVELKKPAHLEKEHIPWKPPPVIEVLLLDLAQALGGFVFAFQSPGLRVKVKILRQERASIPERTAERVGVGHLEMTQIRRQGGSQSIQYFFIKAIAPEKSPLFDQ